MTQNKLDGPQSSKLCKTFKLTKRESGGQDRRRSREGETDQTKPRWSRECTEGKHGERKQRMWAG